MHVSAERAGPEPTHNSSCVHTHPGTLKHSWSGALHVLTKTTWGERVIGLKRSWAQSTGPPSHSLESQQNKPIKLHKRPRIFVEAACANPCTRQGQLLKRAGTDVVCASLSYTIRDNRFNYHKAQKQLNEHKLSVIQVLQRNKRTPLIFSLLTVMV